MRVRHGRPGLSLAEVMVAITLLGLIGTAIGSVILNQQRFQRDASELLNVRQGVRDAMEVLSTDIRGSSSEDTVRLMADSALELFASVGTSVACRTISSNAIELASESAGGNTLTSFLLAPDTGDLALIYRDSADASGSRWERHRIAALAARSGDSGCLLDGIDPREGFVLTLQSPPVPYAKRGAPVRFVRRGRYSLYRSSDGHWYLGYRRCNALGPSICGAIQPISGPYRRYSPDKAQTGFLFEYFNARGEGVAGDDSPLSIARVDITARAEKPRPRDGENAETALTESATSSIAVRNR